MVRFDSLDAWLKWQEQYHPRPIDLGLERVAGVFRRLNAGHKPLTITVAGTNGKGSCVAFLEAIYRAQGYRVGAYTSPHILRYNERIRIDGSPVTDNMICEAFTRIDNVRGDTSLSYFEFGTLAALELFARADLDVQILEVGLGGRLDAVNMIDPDVALVTTIALDHVDWLGHSLEEIGREKAGIFRQGVPAIIGDANAPAALLETALEKAALPLQMGSHFFYRKGPESWDWSGPAQGFNDLPFPAFKGEHQFRNASAVLMAVAALENRLPVGMTAIREGLQGARIKGRFQLERAEVPVLLDVGHNPQAAQTLLAYLQSDFPNVKIHAVFAMMKDKDIAGVITLLRERISAWYLAPLANPRAAGLDVMTDCFQQQGVDTVYAGYGSFTEAFLSAQQAAKPDGMVLVFGSFFLVSEYLSQFS